MDKHKTLISIDFSLNGSAVIIGNTGSENLKYKYFSKLKSDSYNDNCIVIEDGLSSSDKLDNFICYFLSVINTIDMVVLESASFNSSNSSTDFMGGYHIIRYLCRRLDIPYLEIPPISNKLFFTGFGHADKNMMVEQAIKTYGDKIDFENISKKHREDVSDALALFSIGYNYLKCEDVKNNFVVGEIQDFDYLPLHQKQVLATLYGREDLVKSIKRQRDKLKREELKKRSNDKQV